MNQEAIFLHVEYLAIPESVRNAPVGVCHIQGYLSNVTKGHLLSLHSNLASFKLSEHQQRDDI